MATLTLTVTSKDNTHVTTDWNYANFNTYTHLSHIASVSKITWSVWHTNTQIGTFHNVYYRFGDGTSSDIIAGPFSFRIDSTNPQQPQQPVQVANGEFTVTNGLTPAWLSNLSKIGCRHGNCGTDKNTSGTVMHLYWQANSSHSITVTVTYTAKTRPTVNVGDVITKTQMDALKNWVDVSATAVTQNATITQAIGATYRSTTQDREINAEWYNTA